jgi:hypothetical protein
MVLLTPKLPNLTMVWQFWVSVQNNDRIFRDGHGLKFFSHKIFLKKFANGVKRAKNVFWKNSEQKFFFENRVHFLDIAKILWHDFSRLHRLIGRSGDAQNSLKMTASSSCPRKTSL